MNKPKSGTRAVLCHPCAAEKRQTYSYKWKKLCFIELGKNKLKKFIVDLTV